MKKSKIQIDKHIPIPAVDSSGIGVADFPLSEMEVGDSFVIPVEFNRKQQNNICSKIIQHIKRKNLKLRFTVKKDPKSNSIRIWRTTDSKSKPVIEKSENATIAEQPKASPAKTEEKVKSKTTPKK